MTNDLRYVLDNPRNVEIILESVKENKDAPRNSFLLSHAIRENNKDLILKLLESGVKPTGTIFEKFKDVRNCSYWGDIEVFGKIISTLGDDVREIINYKDSNNMTILMTSVKKEIMEIVLKYDDDINHRQIHGYNALMYAVAENNGEIIDLLLEHGADKTLRNTYGDNIYDIARSFNNKHLIEKLES